MRLAFFSHRCSLSCLCVTSAPFTCSSLLFNPSLSLQVCGCWFAVGVRQTHLLQAWDGAACWTDFFPLSRKIFALLPSSSRAAPTIHFTVSSSYLCFTLTQQTPPHTHTHGACVISLLSASCLAAAQVCIPHRRPLLLWSKGNSTGRVLDTYWYSDTPALSWGRCHFNRCRKKYLTIHCYYDEWCVKYSNLKYSMKKINLMLVDDNY